MNELALFAGAGGGILGGHLLGWRTVCAVEWEAFPASVLVARQNDKILPPFPIWDDVQTFDGNPWQGIVDVVSGGFPCQDISAAGKGAGITGARSSMWGHMARIIGEVRPKYAFVENSPMLTTRGLGTVLGDLSEMGYDATWCVLGANDVGARHQRDRIWLLAHSNSEPNAIRGSDRGISQTGGQWSVDQRRSGRNVDGIIKSTSNEEMDSRQQNIFSHTEHNRIRWGEQFSKSVEEKTSRNSIEELAHTSMSRFKTRDKSSFRPKQQVLEKQFGESGHEFGNKDYWAIEPNVGRVVDGMASRVDRLKAIGNGQVPLCAATAWNILIKRINKVHQCK